MFNVIKKLNLLFILIGVVIVIPYRQRKKKELLIFNMHICIQQQKKYIFKYANIIYNNLVLEFSMMIRSIRCHE